MIQNIDHVPHDDGEHKPLRPHFRCCELEDHEWYYCTKEVYSRTRPVVSTVDEEVDKQDQNRNDYQVQHWNIGIKKQTVF
jgi:hypothetical protein